MRGWVGVGEEVTTKMAELAYLQQLESDRISKLSAHLMGTSFQPFASSQITIPRVMIFAFAQPNLENQITQGFQIPAIAIT
ncbi:hypothetical protein A4S05_29660 [Nostoc sp. KVJ20]|nr:hypothetical protein A4S05_29660 [Nostoc sp. KVJ20]